MPDVTDEEHSPAATAVRELLAAYRDHEDLISIGAYRRGGNRAVDAAIDMQDEIDRYLRQPVEQPSTLADAREGVLELYRSSNCRCQRPPSEQDQTQAFSVREVAAAPQGAQGPASPRIGRIAAG